MTAIVGVRDDARGFVVVGGDGASLAGWSLTERADPKVFARVHDGETWVFGFTTSYRFGQILRYHLRLPVLDGEFDEDPCGFMVSKLVPEIRAALGDGGWRKKEHEREEGGCVVLGVRGFLCKIQDDFQVAVPADPYCAAGCGNELALGAFAALHEVRDKSSASGLALVALTAAWKHSGGVRHPFHLVATPPPLPKSEPVNAEE